MSQLTPTEKLTSLLVAEDPELREVVEEFVGGLSQRVEELRAAYEQQDWNTLVTLAHRLKGAGGSYGYPDISQLGAEMERQFKARQDGNFGEFVNRLAQLCAAAAAGLAEPR